MRLLRALGFALWFAVLAWLLSAAATLLLYGVWSGSSFLVILAVVWGAFLVSEARNFYRFMKGDAP